MFLGKKNISLCGKYIPKMSKYHFIDWLIYNTHNITIYVYKKILITIIITFFFLSCNNGMRPKHLTQLTGNGKKWLYKYKYFKIYPGTAESVIDCTEQKLKKNFFFFCYICSVQTHWRYFSVASESTENLFFSLLVNMIFRKCRGRITGIVRLQLNEGINRC